MLFFIYLQGDPGHGQITSRVSRLPGQLKGELPDAVPVVIPARMITPGRLPWSGMLPALQPRASARPGQSTGHLDGGHGSASGDGTEGQLGKHGAEAGTVAGMVAPGPGAPGSQGWSAGRRPGVVRTHASLRTALAVG